MKKTHSKRGSLVPLFLVFVLFAFGVLGTSLYVGRRSENAVSMQMSADASAQGAAMHHARLMNQLAFNNQAIGASINVNAHLLLLAHYLGIGRALMFSVADVALQKAQLAAGEEDAIQKIFSVVHKVGSQYVRMAMGTSQYSQDLLQLKVLAYGAPLRAAELATLNRPSSVALTFQGKNPVPMATEMPQGLRQSTTRDTICHSTGATQGAAAHGGSLLPFLMGPLLTLSNGASPAAKALEGAIGVVEGSLLGILPIKPHIHACGIGLTGSLVDLFTPEAGRGTAKEAHGTADAIFARIGPQPENDLKRLSGGNLCSLTGNRRFLDKVLGSKFGVSERELQLSLSLHKVGEELKDNETTTIPYSGASASECEGQTRESKPLCFQEFVISKSTFICPLIQRALSARDPNSELSLAVAELQSSAHQCQPTGGETGVAQLRSSCSGFNQFLADGAKPQNGNSLIDWGKQMETFSANINNNQKLNLGFVVIADRQQLQESLRFRTLLAEPQWTRREFLQNKAALCANRTFTTASGAEICAVAPVEGMNPSTVEAMDSESGTQRDDAVFQLIDGGATVYEKLRREGDLMGRMQLSFSSYEAIYSPENREATLATLWPAWVAQPQRASLADFFPESTRPLAGMIDRLLGNPH